MNRLINILDNCFWSTSLELTFFRRKIDLPLCSTGLNPDISSQLYRLCYSRFCAYFPTCSGCRFGAVKSTSCVSRPKIDLPAIRNKIYYI